MPEVVVPSRRAGVASRRRRVALVAAAVATFIALLAALTYTPVFDAKEVRVVGVDRLAADDVARAAGVGEGTNVFHLDTVEAEHALEADPWIDQASVVRDLPSTVVIRVDERVPVAVVDDDVLAADGTVLPGADATGLPMVRAVRGALDPPDVIAAATAAAALAPAVLSRISAILVEPDDDLVLTVDGDVTVVYGAPGEDAAKAEALKAVLRWVHDEGVEIVTADVSVPAAPTARPAGSTTVPVS